MRALRAWRAAVATGLAVAAGVTGVTQTGAAAAGQPPLALPDLRIFVPTNLISIGIAPGTGHRELRFTHITADVGAGPFEMDPHYNPQTGSSTFTQRLYRASGQGSWTPAASVPLAAAGTWQAPSDYRFPLTRFTLNRLGSGGSVRSVVAVSPKVDYCITGDTQVSGVPNTPGQTFIPVEHCTDPTQPLGWSVGWGDQYDQTDAGQPIDINHLPDGTYVLRATVDPDHVFRERTTDNDVTDTRLRITGDQVTVLAQQTVKLPLPRVRMTSPDAGGPIWPGVALSASVTAPTGVTVRSVQFLLDGEPMGPALVSAPYDIPWTVSGVAPGRHYLSARVVDSEGVSASAVPVAVSVVRGPPVSVRRLRWRQARLTLVIGGVPGHDSVLAVVTTAHGRHRYVIHGHRLNVASAQPSSLALELRGPQHGVLARVRVPLNARPSVRILNPAAHQTVFGITPLSAQAEDAVGVTSVRFLVDGHSLGHPVDRAPYSLHWDTRGLATGPHLLEARVLDALGHEASTQIPVRVQNPAPAMTCFVLQRHQSARGSGAASVPGFQTAVAGETLLAFVSADGPDGSHQRAVVAGGGVGWHLVSRADASPGTAEVWQAIASKGMRLSPITATLSSPGYDVSLDVVAMEGADGTGAQSAASGRSGAPSATLHTESGTSLVFAVGHDWGGAAARRLPVGWVTLDQWLDQGAGDTFWTQYTNQPTGPAGARVNASAPAPASSAWNLAAVELINDGS